MQKVIPSMNSRNFDFLMSLSIVVVIVLCFALLAASTGKKEEVDLPLGWNIGLCTYFATIAFFSNKRDKKRNKENKKDDISIYTILSCIFAIAFLYASFS